MCVNMFFCLFVYFRVGVFLGVIEGSRVAPALVQYVSIKGVYRVERQ